MHGDTSYSTCPSAWPGLMKGSTTPRRCQAALLELMEGTTAAHTWLAACFGCMRGDTSCLVDPPRASTCQAACDASTHGDSSSLYRHSAFWAVDTTILTFTSSHTVLLGPFV
ncbi:hypothetical protein F2Q69_00042594 [Brassica cretica]|uniref:Uncharacterized protein n=1 Tax=Brassica cretica TaxID=69181 RepID=A0A8S9N9J7_BRACR|nr:hypothetical protein F2Q69_00042594 [Brassica cretica]